MYLHIPRLFSKLGQSNRWRAQVVLRVARPWRAGVIWGPCLVLILGNDTNRGCRDLMAAQPAWNCCHGFHLPRVREQELEYISGVLPQTTPRPEKAAGRVWAPDRFGILAVAG